MEINEVKIARVLNPTSINLGDFVINPYRGCGYGCLYCYVRFNKVPLHDKREWGDYVDVRINTPEQLEKELKIIKPKRILLGSTTECFGPWEKKYNITEKVLDILNNNGIFFSILTRSPIIAEYIDLLKKGMCETVYFTFNSYPERLKTLLEPKSPSFKSRVEAINELLDNDINVIPYVSPVLPGISKFDEVFTAFPKARLIEFETLNFNLGNIDEIIVKISSMYSKASELYLKMKTDEKFYNSVWNKVKKDLMVKSIESKKTHKITVHKLGRYFENKY